MTNKRSPQVMGSVPPASPAVASESPVMRSPSRGSLLRWLLPVLVVLLVLGALLAVVWGTRPGTVEVYEPPAPAQKTVGQIQQQIDSVKSNTHMPKATKGRILGFLEADLQKAKNAQGISGE